MNIFTYCLLYLTFTGGLAQNNTGNKLSPTEVTALSKTWHDGVLWFRDIPQFPSAYYE